MKRVMFFLVVVVLSACSDVKYTPKPDDFYGDDKMADIMTDLYLLEATMTSDRGAFTELQILPSDFIYKKYETDSLTFQENLYYYSDRTLVYDLLMDQVDERLDVLLDSVAVRQVKESKRKEEEYKAKAKERTLELDPDNTPMN
jgi:hypothetical protein